MAQAAQRYRESLIRLHALGDSASVAIALARSGQTLAAQGDLERAILTLNVAHGVCIECNRQECVEIEAALRQAEEQIGAEQATRLRRQADAMTLDDAVARALQALPR